jgi:hypothetical protein
MNYVQTLIPFDKFCHVNFVCAYYQLRTYFQAVLLATLTGQTMKKFSTATLILASAAIFAAYAPLAQAAPANLPAVGNARCAFLKNAPDQHVVVRGDTLWGISSKFLEHAWCWPQVWGMNRAEIRNPHWIYPGQIVYFDRVAGRLRLGRPTGSGSYNGSPSNVRLSPQVRISKLDDEAILAISPAVIEPFLTQPLVIEEDEFKGTPHIVATQEGHVFVGKDEKAYVRGDLKGETSFQGYRPGKPLKDPVTKLIIGYEAVYLGELKLVRAGKAADEADTFIVTNSKEEMGVGDRLMPLPPRPMLNYVPHAPERPVEARVVAVYGGVSQAGQNQIVSINRGAEDGLDLGTVLELYTFGETIKDTTDDKKKIKLPNEKYGELFVFRTFKHISYALIMQVSNSVQIGDLAKSPDSE